MARVQTETEVNAEALRTVAAPRMQAVQVSADPNKSSTFQLAEALGAASPTIERFRQEQEQKRTQEQLLKVDAYKERAKVDIESGAVTATQVGKLYPELVPTVRARVAESVGFDHGRTLVQPVIQEILQNPNLRLDTAARAKFLEEKRKEILGGITGDDFFTSGAVKAIEGELKTYENTWQQQTATYHNEVLTKGFRREVGDVFATATTPAAVRDALNKLDTNYKYSSSLNNIERNKAIVEEVTSLAFISKNPDIMDLIPDRYLNTDSKAEIVKIKAQVQSHKMGILRDEIFLEGVARDRAVRDGKTQIIRDAVAGKPINPGDYMGNNELFEYANNLKDVSILPEATSVKAAQTIRTSILNGSSVAGLDQNKTINSILNDKTINPREKQKLIDEVPKLLEGRIVMEDPMVQVAVNKYIDPILSSLERSDNAQIVALTKSRNLRAVAMDMFESGIQDAMIAHYEDKGSWPTGTVKRDIIKRERQETIAEIERMMKLGGGYQPPPNNSQPAPAPAPAPAVAPSQAPAPAPAPRAPTPSSNPVTITSDAEYQKLPSGALFKGPDGKVRRKP